MSIVAWMSHLLKNKRRRIVVLISAGVITLGLILLGALLWLRHDYHSRLANWGGQINQVIAESTAQFESIQHQPDKANAVQSGMQTLAQRLSELKPPPAPFIGGDRTDIDKKTQAETALQQTVTTLQAATAVLAYQPQIAQLLSGQSAKTTENQEQLQAFTGDWRQLADTLTNIDPPQPVADAHASLQQLCGAITTDLDALVQLFEKQDADGFAAKNQGLQEKFASLQQLQSTFADVAKQQDQQIAATLATLNTAVQALR